MPKIKGFEEALKLLKALSGSEAKKLISEIKEKEPSLALKLEESMLEIEDIAHLSTAQLITLLRDINLLDLGLALRVTDKNIVSKILNKVSTGIKLDIEEGLSGPPRKMEDVYLAQDRILKVLQEKIDQGFIVIDPDEKLV